MSELQVMANWPSPPHVHALTTFRLNGHSAFPYDSNNLSYTVGDKPIAVTSNRAQLKLRLGLSQTPIWLEQTHSTECTDVDKENNRRADASITRCAETPLAIMTADCLPILLTNRAGTEIAAIHAGWRGLVNGIIENTLKKLLSSPSEILAWIGPGICQKCFEVGEDVFEAFQAAYSFSADAFHPANQKWKAHLPYLAEKIFNHLGILAVYQANLCTFEHKRLFYSYRRTKQTGRMATLIWFTNSSLKDDFVG